MRSTQKLKYLQLVRVLCGPHNIVRHRTMCRTMLCVHSQRNLCSPHKFVRGCTFHKKIGSDSGCFVRGHTILCDPFVRSALFCARLHFWSDLTAPKISLVRYHIILWGLHNAKECSSQKLYLHLNNCAEPHKFVCSAQCTQLGKFPFIGNEFGFDFNSTIILHPRGLFDIHSRVPNTQLTQL